MTQGATRRFTVGMPCRLPVALITLACCGVLGVAAPRGARAQTAADGQTLFAGMCKACHTIGGGALVGPDLAGVTKLRTKDWLARWIAAPSKMLAAHDPTATELFNQYNKVTMPDFGLTAAQVASVIAYLESGATTAAAGSAAPAPLPAGEAARGRSYFVGGTGFTNGGPHCISCHSVAGLSSLGGGNLGPDLTNSGYVKSEPAFAAFIGAPSTTTMAAIWAKTPLTTQEQADLYAFLSKAAVQQREPGALLQIALLCIAGAALMVVVAQLYWRKRSKGVRKPMIARTYSMKRG